MLVLGPDIPAPLQPVLKSIIDAIRDLQEPGRPVRVPFVALAADLPQADRFPDHMIEVREKQCLAVSTLSGSNWVWLRSDGTAL